MKRGLLLVLVAYFLFMMTPFIVVIAKKIPLRMLKPGGGGVLQEPSPGVLMAA